MNSKIGGNDPFKGVETANYLSHPWISMQRHKDVKCRSTFETGSNLAKDFKDTKVFSQAEISAVDERNEKQFLGNH